MLLERLRSRHRRLTIAPAAGGYKRWLGRFIACPYHEVESFG